MAYVDQGELLIIQWSLSVIHGESKDGFIASFFTPVVVQMRKFMMWPLIVMLILILYLLIW